MDIAVVFGVPPDAPVIPTGIRRVYFHNPQTMHLVIHAFHYALVMLQD